VAEYLQWNSPTGRGKRADLHTGATVDKDDLFISLFLSTPLFPLLLLPLD